MFKLQWNGRANAPSAHPLADPSSAAQLIAELPVESPARAVAEAAACLESIEAEPFTPAHRLKVVSMMDEAVRGCVEQLTLAYLGAVSGNAANAGDWRVLMEYLDRVSAAYASIVEACAAQRSSEVFPRIPLLLVRAMRSVVLAMKVSWLRYLPPDRAAWEMLIRCFRTARARGAAEAMVTAYESDGDRSCALFELATAVMFSAAAPQALTLRQVEIAYRLTCGFRARFTVTPGREVASRHFLLDLDHAGPPVRLPGQVPAGSDVVVVSAGPVHAEVRAIADSGADAGFLALPHNGLGSEFGLGEKLGVVEHVLRFWDENPPERRDERHRIDSRIEVEIGIGAVKRELECRAERDNDLSMLEVAVEGNSPRPVAALHGWTLTDISARGVGARLSRRLDRFLRIGSVVGLKLEPGGPWTIAIVRRLRTDVRNQTDVGFEILARAAALVRLEGLAINGLPDADAGASVHSAALLLPDAPELHSRASLLLEPATWAPGQCFVMIDGPDVRHVRLRGAAEALDGWERVEFDVLQ